jgi:hypothetical protein
MQVCDVMCQCVIVPSALAAIKTFELRDAAKGGRKQMLVMGSCSVDADDKE